MIARLAASEPDPAVQGRYDLFGQFIGSWDFQVTAIPADREPQHFRGRWDFGWILDGRAIQDVLVTEPAEGEPARPLAERMGTTVRADDPQLDARWTSWMSPGDREFCTLLARQDGDRIVLDGQWSPGIGAGRFVWAFSDIEPDRFRWQGHVSSDGGETWRLVAEMIGVRRTTPDD